MWEGLVHFVVIFQIGLAHDSGYDGFPLVMQIRHVVCQGVRQWKKQQKIGLWKTNLVTEYF